MSRNQNKVVKTKKRKASVATARRPRDAQPAACSGQAASCKKQANEALLARAARVMELPLAHMPNKEFCRAKAAERILAPTPAAEATRTRKTARPTDLPHYLASLYEVPLLTAAQEQHLFRQYNFLKYRATVLRNRLDPACPDPQLVEEIEQLHEQAVEVKNQLIRANLRLVVSIAKKHARQDNFFDLVSDGNVSLMRAVEKFNYALGFKFSTYATWAIKKNYARDHMTQAKYADRFRTSLEESLDWTPDVRSNNVQQERMQETRSMQVNQVLAQLNDREREIIQKRFGLNNYSQAQTLQEVGDGLGISKERIRQIEARALDKLRKSIPAEAIDAL